MIVKSRTITTPTHIRPTSGHNSFVLPISHCPMSAPTTTSPKCKAPYHKASVESPTKSPTTVTQVMKAAIGSPNPTSTAKPKDAPTCSSRECTACKENAGISANNTKPKRMYAEAQISCQI